MYQHLNPSFNWWRPETDTDFEMINEVYSTSKSLTENLKLRLTISRMDRVFETLLLNQSGNTTTNNGTEDTNNINGNSNTLRQPNPSRYAQLIPNEMLQQQPPNKDSPMVEVVDVDTNDKSNTTTADAAVAKDKVEENVRVYKMDKSTGQLELLPEDNYDVVYVDNNNNSMDKVEKKNEADKVMEDKVMDMAFETANAMDIDNDKEEEEISANIQKDDSEEDLIYIVKTPSINHQQQTDIETSSSSSSIDELNCNLISNSTTKPFNSQAQITIASSTASNIARTLVSRTTNYNNLRPSYTMLLQNEQRDIEQQQQRQQRELQKKKDKAKLLSKGGGANNASGGMGKEGEKNERKVITTQESVLEKAQRLNEEQRSSKLAASLVKDAKVISDPDNTVNNNTNDDNASSIPKSTLLQAKLSPSLTSNTNIIDGDTLKVISRLTKLRKYQESNIQPQMTHLELDNWENEIDWLGYGSFDDDEEDDDDEDDVDGVKKGNEGKGKVEGNSKECKDEGGKNDAMETEDEGSCCPDFTSSHLQQPSFKPPVPFGGYAKRYKRQTTNEDPLELLFEPRNPRLDALDLTSAVNWEGVTSDTTDDESSTIEVVPLILQSSIAGQSVATLLAPNPTSRPLPFESHPNYQSRYERELSNDITSTADLSKPGGFGSIEALEKYKAMRQRKREQMAKDKQSRVTEVMSALSLTGTGRRITSSLMGPGGAERTGRPSRHALGSSSVHDAEYVEQLELVYNHSLVKPDLTMSEYRQFHRPRLPLKVVSMSCPWQFQARKVVNAENTKRGVGGSKRAQLASADGSTIVGSYHAMMSAGANRGQSKIRTEADLSPSMGDLVIMEYVEERPPLFMTKGMTCRIVNYYRGDRSRCPISAGGGDRPLRKRHGDKAASANQGPTPSGPSNRAERPPRLIGPNQYKIKSQADLIGIIGTTKKKKSKEALALEAKKAKENAVDILPEGVTEILHQKVHGPFIGEVEENQTQTGLISNLFAAPMFRHNSEPTDFLMVCGQLKGKPRFSNPSDTSVSLGVVLRPLPKNIYCVGQTEPRVKVFSPNTNDEKKFTNAFVLYQIAKNIQRAEEHDGSGLSFDYIRDKLFANSLIPHGQLRIRIKQVGNFERNIGTWSLKATGEDDFVGVDALGRKVSPEGVAAYESQCAHIRKLQELGIKELYSGGNTITNVASVMIYLNAAAQAAMERRLKMKKVLEIKRRAQSDKLVYYEKCFEKLDKEYKEAKKRQEVSKFIYEELQLAPWYLSSEFIDVHKRSVGGAMMKLTGMGDPSGVGEAYNFIREPDTRNSKRSTANSNGALNAQIKKITGTENDLRKLTMKQMASLLRSYGMKDKQISVLKRWDRVHVIRDLSTKAASDGMGDDMERFARGEKLRLSDQRQNYKERIQEISRRQVAALSAEAGSSDLAMQVEMDAENAKDTNEADAGSDVGKDKDDDSNKSDSSDDDDFFAEMEMEMTNTNEANRLVSGLRADGGGKGLDAQALSKDAREFAALQRQREEERAMQDGLDHKLGGAGHMPKKKFKVIRRKITKTRPDGVQTVSFEFIVNREKVDDIIAKKQEREADEKKLLEKKRKKKVKEEEYDRENACVGHSMFEDDDNVKSRRSNKIKIRKETTKGKPGPKKKTSSIKHAREVEQEMRKKKRMKKQDEAELYTKPVTGKGKAARKHRGAARERMPHVIFSDYLETLRNAVEMRPNAGAFRSPVSREYFPHYYEIITHPIDLSTIRDKNRMYKYPTADEFVKEFELMKMNAIKFNGKGSDLANEAVDIYEHIRNAVKSNRAEITEMEEAVRDQKSGKKKRAKAASASSNKPINTASVVLDGVETQVNLGSLDKFV